MTGCIEKPTDINESLPGTISGKVTVSGGGPLAGVTVKTNPESGTAVSDAEGNYTITGINPGVYELYTVIFGYGGYTANVTVTGGARMTHDIVLTADDGGVTGTVFSSNGGELLSGVVVTLMPGSKTALTDSTGRYSMLGVAPGSYTVSVSLLNYGSASDTVRVLPAVLSVKNFILTAQSGSIAGTIINSAGSGLGGVSISTEPATSAATTNSSGVYIISGIVSGSYKMKVQLEGYKPDSANTVVTAGTTLIRNFTLQRQTGSITGTVTSNGGSPLSGVSITTVPQTSTVTTNSDGRYTIANIPTGDYTISGSLTGYLPASGLVTVNYGLTTIKDLVLTYNLGSISGTVKTSLGANLSGVKIETNPPSKEVYSTSTGEYILSDITAQTYTVSASKTGYITGTGNITVTPGTTTTHNFALAAVPPPGGTLSGYITSASGGGVAGAIVTTHPASSIITTDGDGYFYFSGLSSGSYILYARKTGYIGNSKSVSVNQTAGTVTDLALTPGTPLVNIPLVNITGGNYQMGHTFATITHRDETPEHPVTLSNYSLSAYEITFAQYDAFCDATGRAKPADEGWGRGSRPVINVSWDDAVAFCSWAANQMGRHVRLPTEAEWEYAARQRGENIVYSGTSNDNQASTYAWYYPQSGSKSQPVGTKTPNSLGLYDMSGNVWEWCSDWYDIDYYSYCYNLGTVTNPAGPSSGVRRVYRGGCFDDDLISIRAAYRGYGYFTGNFNRLRGFRAAGAYAP